MPWTPQRDKSSGRDAAQSTGPPSYRYAHARPLDDVVHLLGVAGDCLIASGQQLYWIGIAGPRAGNIAHVWPEGPDKPGYGRGVLAGSVRPLADAGEDLCLRQQTARLKKEIDLGPLGVRGGNLLVADGRLLIATPSELIVLGTNGGPKERAGSRNDPKKSEIRISKSETNPKSKILMTKRF